MIREDLFKNCINVLHNYNDYEDTLANWGINIWEREEVANLITAYIQLLQYCCKDEPEPECLDDTSVIDHFIYETNFGRDKKKAFENNGLVTTIHNVDDLWDYLKASNPDIVDENA